MKDRIMYIECKGSNDDIIGVGAYRESVLFQNRKNYLLQRKEASIS